MFRLRYFVHFIPLLYDNFDRLSLVVQKCGYFFDVFNEVCVSSAYSFLSMNLRVNY